MLTDSLFCKIGMKLRKVMKIQRSHLRVCNFSRPLGPVHMVSGQLIAPGQLTDPVVQHRVTRLAEVTFLHLNRTHKLPWGQLSLVHAHY